jgi:hypothetical protein
MSNSRRASRPTTKKKNVISPLLIQLRRSSVTPQSATRIDSSVCQTLSYEWASTLTQTRAARVAKSRKAALPVSVRRNSRSGVSRFRAHAVRPENAPPPVEGGPLLISSQYGHREQSRDDASASSSYAPLNNS